MDDDDIRREIARLMRQSGIDTSHISTSQFKQSWGSSIWNGIKSLVRYGAPIAGALAHLIPVVGGCMLM